MAANALQLGDVIDGPELHVARRWTDVRGLRVAEPLLEISIDGGPAFMATKQFFVDLFDEVLNRPISEDKKA